MVPANRRGALSLANGVGGGGSPRVLSALLQKDANVDLSTRPRRHLIAPLYIETRPKKARGYAPRFSPKFSAVVYRDLSAGKYNVF